MAVFLSPSRGFTCRPWCLLSAWPASPPSGNVRRAAVLQLTRTPAARWGRDRQRRPDFASLAHPLAADRMAASPPRRRLFLVAAADINVIAVDALHETAVDVERIAIVHVDPDTHPMYSLSRTRAAIDAILAAAAEHPDITASAAVASLLIRCGVPQALVPGRSASRPLSTRSSGARPLVTLQLFEDLWQSRCFTAWKSGSADNTSAPRVAIVNEAFALRRWGTRNVAGRELRLTQGSRAQGRADATDRLSIVGVVADTDVGRTGSRDHGLVYVPLDQQDHRSVLFTARSEGDPRVALMALRAALRRVDQNLVVEQAATGTLYLAGQYVVLGFVAALVTTLGALALLLAMTGLFGVISHVVSRRTRELAVRLALGAERSRIMRLVFADGLRPVADGLVLGLFAGAIGRAIIAATMSASVAAVDPIAFVAVPILFVSVALAACYWPARRAARVDPNVALRE